MRQTICQKCGTVNHGNAIVCTECGVKLAHSERKAVARMKNSMFVQTIASAPGRLMKWIFKKIKLVVMTLLVLLIGGGGLLYFFLFVPLSWQDYPMPQPVPADDTEFKVRLQLLRKNGGIFAADPLTIRQLGNMLIFNPAFGQYRAGKNKDALREPDRNNGYFSFIKMPHDQFGMILYQKINQKLPFRLMVVFTARRGQNGLLELESCRIGNLPVPAFILRMAAEIMLNNWNPDQQFMAAFDRIQKGEMELQLNGKEEKITLTVSRAEN